MEEQEQTNREKYEGVLRRWAHPINRAPDAVDDLIESLTGELADTLALIERQQTAEDRATVLRELMDDQTGMPPGFPQFLGDQYDEAQVEVSELLTQVQTRLEDQALWNKMQLLSHLTELSDLARASDVRPGE